MIQKKNILYVLFFIVAGIVTGQAQVRVSQKNTLVNNKKIIHGVCRQNLQQVKQLSVVEDIADNMVHSNIPLVRLSGVKGGGSIGQVVSNIKTFQKKNIKVHLSQPMCMDMFREGYETVPGPNFRVFKMSDIDPDRFSSFMDKLLKTLAQEVDRDALIGLELFNEANWGDFNGDLQPASDGKGQVFTVDTPLDNPSFKDTYAGILKYGKCLEITRKKLDEYFPGKSVKLVTHGLVIGNAQNNYSWMIKRGISFVTPGMFLTILQGKHPKQKDKTNYLQFADGVGIHMYPSLADDMEKELATKFFEPVVEAMQKPMPFWITEWGFAKAKFKNNGGEAKRLEYMQRFVKALESLKNINVEMTTLYEFDAAKNHNIWENGQLLESGKIFESINK